MSSSGVNTLDRYTLSMPSSSWAFMYFHEPPLVVDTCRSRAATSIVAKRPSGKVPTVTPEQFTPMLQAPGVVNHVFP